jgi:hypothetical protein
MEVIHPSVRPGHQFCPSCGEALAGDPRFCPSCGTDVRSAPAIAPPERRLEHQPIAGDSAFPTPPPSSRQGRPWGMIIPLVAAGLVIVLLAGWLVSMNGRLNSTKTALQAEQSHVTRLNGKVSSLSTQIDGLKGQKSTLETQVSSLNGALVDCKEAANTGLTAYNVFVKFFRGTASVYDLRTAVDEANRALSVCRTEARTNGAI